MKKWKINMEIRIWDVIAFILSFLSFAWAIISEEFRILAITLSFLLGIILVISSQNSQINKIIYGQKKLEEKLKIHEQLIDIKAEIKNLKERIKNGKGK